MRLIRGSIYHEENPASIAATSSLRISEDFRMLSESLPALIWVADAEGAMIYINPRWAEYSGISGESLLGNGWFQLLHPDDVPRATAIWQKSIAEAHECDMQYRLLRHDGQYRWFMSRVEKFHDPKTDHVRWIGRHTDIDAQIEVKEERQRTEDGLRLLARTGAIMLSTLDYKATLLNIARGVTFEYASYCLIDTLNARGDWERTLSHHDAELEKILEKTRFLSRPHGQHPIALALMHGRSSVVEISDQWASDPDTTLDRLDIVRELGIRSICVVPLMTPKGTIAGALTCALDRSISKPNYSSHDLHFVEEVGRRAGKAIVNARRFERELHISITLQEASLSIVPQRIGNVELTADYLPGNDEASIGGDWYDVFPLRDGRVVFTMGDVLGSGLTAAVLMTKLRQAMQSAALLQADPVAILAVAEETLSLQTRLDTYATALAAIYDPQTHMLEIASAGHPAPRLIRIDGSIEDIPVCGLLLGLDLSTRRESVRYATPPGTLLVFYTDGLIESRRDVLEGSERLSHVLASIGMRESGYTATDLMQAMVGSSQAADDSTVMIARIMEPQGEML